MTRTLYIDKTSGTFADPLLAYGLAVVVNGALERSGGRGRRTVHLSDHGSYYVLECSPAPDDARLAAMQGPFMPAAVIRTRKNAASLPADLPPQTVIDYETERDKRSDYFELRKNLSPEAQSALRRGQDHPALEALRGQEPHEHWDILRAINPSALMGYNKLMIQWWTIQPALVDVLYLLRDLFAQTPNDLQTANEAWKALDKTHGWKIPASTTAGQIYNPSQGKGQNRTKANKLTMGNVNSDLWLLEWLKAVGFYHAALTKQLSGVKDRKTYVLAPVELDLDTSDQVMRNFRDRMVRSEPAIRSDVLAAIRYTHALLSHAEAAQGSPVHQALLRHRRPNRIVSGFYSTFYKDLGNAVATMNISFIGLPGWIQVQNHEDVTAVLGVLDEHETIVRQFDEAHSDAYNLLLCYRDFLSGNDLGAFFEFTTLYSSYLIGQRERKTGRARQFSEDNLRRLIVSAEPTLSPILDTAGFQNIAYAIRQSTVVAQYRKGQGDRRYNVRYGLGTELARKANYAGEFVTALSDFVFKYNAENAQVMETRSGPYRRSIQTSDVDDIVQLVDTYGAPLICNLLVAYGYARSPRTTEDDES